MRRLILLALAIAPLASAHVGEPLKPHDLWYAWSFDPGIIIPLSLTALLYLRGAQRIHGITPKQKFSFWTGWFILCVALLSPLHPLGEVLFSAHMAQHELLMVVVAPLLVIARPLVGLLWGWPFTWRRSLGHFSKRTTVQGTWRFFTHPMTAWWVHAAALWLWHIPRLFQATLQSDWIHSAQHVSFLGSALLFWWSLFYGHSKVRYGASVIYVFTTAVHTSILGALLTFSSAVWYPAYAITAPAWGLTPLEDQQAGGLIMWIPAGLVYLIVGLILFGEWMRESDRVAKTRPYAGKGEYAA
ncbi:MAG: cytochrome c oxidase assembly protein [Acidobacteriota bacterium]|nr:cytochrome c oxidase assembly protein [Acidobacteriota bacterium]